MIHLTRREQWAINLADELEYAGFTAAAGFLRKRIAILKPVWDKDDPALAPTKLNAPSDLLRIHHGSTPPAPPVYPSAPPVIMTPSPRPDQPTA